MSYIVTYKTQKIKECSSVDYILLLCQSIIVSVFHTLFGYKIVQYRKDEKKCGYQQDCIKLEDAIADNMDQNSVGIIYPNSCNHTLIIYFDINKKFNTQKSL